MSVQKWIYDREMASRRRQEAGAHNYAGKVLADVPVDYPERELLYNLFYLERLAEAGTLPDQEDLHAKLEACKIELREALDDQPAELGEVIGERPSTANALGRKALGSVEPDAIGA